MKKNVLIISSSLRNKSNSDILADEFMRGAADGGNSVEKVSLSGKNIAFCKGCLACQKTHKCVIDDDSREITEKMLNADVIVFATPVYYYSMCGQLKTLLDRANPLYGSDYKFRDVYLLATAADGMDSAVGGTMKGIQGWVECFDKAEFKKTVFAGGVNDCGEIEGHEALKEAYDVGHEI